MASGHCGSYQTCGESGRRSHEWWVNHSYRGPAAHWFGGPLECYWGSYRCRHHLIQALMPLQSCNPWAEHSKRHVSRSVKGAADFCRV